MTPDFSGAAQIKINSTSAFDIPVLGTISLRGKDKVTIPSSPFRNHYIQLIKGLIR